MAELLIPYNFDLNKTQIILPPESDNTPTGYHTPGTSSCDDSELSESLEQSEDSESVSESNINCNYKIIDMWCQVL